MRRLLLSLGALAVLAALSGVRADDKGGVKPPVARKVPHEVKIHGDTLVDNYFWMREKNNPEVLAHLEAENAHTESATKHTKPLEATLYKEILGRVKQTDMAVPVRQGGYFYYSR